MPRRIFSAPNICELYMQIYTADFQNTQVARSFYGSGTVTPLPKGRKPQQSENVQKSGCPFCGGQGSNCCGSQDKAQISPEARQKLNSANPGYAVNQNGESQNQQGHTSETEESLLPRQQGTSNPEAVTPTPGNQGNKLNPDQNGNNPYSANQEKDGKEEKNNPNDAELSEEEQEKVQDMKERDREVRQHEQAHLAAAGHLANGGAHIDTEKGPDGNAYAVSGHVNISVGGGDTPEERLQNAKQAERAALAPAEPSAADRKVAAAAQQKATKAQQEINEEQADEMQTESPRQTGSTNKQADNKPEEISRQSVISSIFNKHNNEENEEENGITSAFGKSSWIADQYSKNSLNPEPSNTPQNGTSSEKLESSILAFA